MAVPPLRITFVSTQAVPYILGNNSKGEAQFAGKVPHALHRLKAAQVSLILPLFKQTEQALANNGLTAQMERDLYRLTIKSPALELEKPEKDNKEGGPIKQIKARVHRLTQPYGYPVYFIDQKEYFGRDKMYGEEDDLTRFSVYYKLTLALMRAISERVDIIDAAENQGAWAAIHLKNERDEATREFGPFFRGTKSALRITTFYYKAEVGLPELGRSGFGAPNLLGEGIRLADMSYARSKAYIKDRALSGAEGKFLAFASTQALAEKRMTGLWKEETFMVPGSDLTEEAAQEAAKRLLTIYAHLADRPIDPVVQSNAAQTSPPLIWSERVWTPREKLLKTNPEAASLYDLLSQEDKDIIDLEIREGREARFVRVKSKNDLDNIINFLKIGPRSAAEKLIDFETLLKDRVKNDTAPWISLFYPGDLNRLLWSYLDLSKSKNKKFHGRTNVRIINAMIKIGILPHIIRFFESLQRISRSQHMSPAELDKMLCERGRSDELATQGLSRNALDFLMLSAIHQQLLVNTPLYQAFIIGVLLHDIGKCLGGDDSLSDNHPENGLILEKEIPAIGLLLDERQRALAQSVIRHHSTISDAVITHEARLSEIEDISTLFVKDHEMLLFFYYALLIIGVADMDAAQSKARLDPTKIIRLWQVVEVMLSSSNINILRKKLAILGISADKEGDIFWNDLVVRYFADEYEEKTYKDKEKKEKKETKEDRREAARNEVIQYCRRQAKYQPSPNPAKVGKKKNKHRDQIPQTEFFKLLGSIKILNIADLLREIVAIRHKAKFVIIMVAIAKQTGKKRFRLKIAKKEFGTVLAILSNSTPPENMIDKFDFSEVDEAGVTNIRLASRSRA